MKRVFLLAVLCFWVTIGMSQNLKGIVKDQNNVAIPGANVQVLNSFIGTATNLDGEYNIRLKPGNYSVQFSFIGHEKVKKDFQISDKDVKINIILEQKALVTEDVIVLSTRASDKMSASFENMNQKDIEKRKMVQDIPYMIQLTPSVVATSETGTGVGYTSLRIRGTDPTRINVTIDGIPYNDAESQGTFWVNMPDLASSISSVQIQRGVGTSTNGSSAFGASMNFKTKALNSKPYAEINANAGSFNTFKGTILAGTGLLNNHFTVDARYSRILSDGYIDRAFVNHESFQVSGAYRSEKDLLKASLIHGNQKTGITWWGTPQDSVEWLRDPLDTVTTGNNPTYNPAGEYTDENGNKRYYDGQTDNYNQTICYLQYTHVFNDKLNLNAALHYTKGNGYYEQYKEDEPLSEYGLSMIPLTDTTSVSESDLIRRKMMENDFYGGILSVNYTSGRWTSSIGGGWNRYDGDHFGQLIWLRYASNSEINQEYYNNNGLKTDANVYAKTNFSLTEKLNIYGDIQYRHIDYEMKGTDDDFIGDAQRDLTQDHHFDFINPKTGIYYNINDRMNTYASFALGHREPTRTHFKEATGDATKIPKSETLFDYELGYRYQGKIFALGINLYYMDYIDQLVPTGEKNSVGYDIMTNVEDSYRRGIEIMGGVKISELIDWNLNLTLSQNKINNFTYWSSCYDADWNETYESRTMEETDIAYSPSIIGGSRLSYQIMKDFNLSLISKYVGKQYFDNLSSEKREIKAYFINNIELNYSFRTKSLREISLKFQLNNITNVEYANNAYGGIWHENGVEKTWAYYFPQAGIHFMTGIVIKL